MSKGHSILRDTASVAEWSDDIKEQVKQKIITTGSAGLPSRGDDNSGGDAGGDGPLARTTIDDLPAEKITDALYTLDRQAAAGATGLTPATLAQLHEHGASLPKLVNALYHGKFRKRMPLLMGGRVVPLTKSNGGIRPVVPMDSIAKLLEKTVFSAHKAEIADALCPHQLGVGIPAGTECIVHGLREYLRAHRDHVAQALDISNAFGAVTRRSIYDAISRRFPSLAHCFLATYGQAPVVVTPGGDTLHMRDGIAQGGPLSPAYFALATIHALKETDKAHPTVTVVAYLDDTYIVGPRDDVKAAAERLDMEIRRTGLKINEDKTVVIPYGDQTAKVLGVPLFGPYEASHLDETRRALDLASAHLPAQLVFQFLRYCITTKSGYFMRTTRRSKEHCEALDDIIAEQLRRMMGAFKPLSSRALTRARRPIKQGGLGLRRQTSVAPAAFLGSVCSFSKSPHHPFQAYTTPGAELEAEIAQAIADLHLGDDGPRDTRDVLNHDARSLQQFLTQIMDRKTGWDENPRNRAIQRGASLHGGYEWLLALPSCKDLRMSDKVFRFALSQRIRTPCSESRASGSCYCCGREMKLDHAEVCDSTKTGRHDYMQNAISRAFMQLNRRATQEPSGFPGAGGKRGDILSFDKSGDYTVFDLVFAAPAASSYQPQAAKVNLYAASQAEQRKIKKYQAILRDQGDFKFVPIAIEAGSGAWGSKFRKFFSSDLMSTTDPQTPPHVRTFTSMHSSTYWRQVLSIARCKAECYANLRCIGQMPHDKRGKNQPGSVRAGDTHTPRQSTQTVQRARAQAQRNHQQGKRTRKRKHPQTTPPGHSGQRSNDSNNGTAATAAATATTDNDEGQPRSAPVTSRSPGGPAATEPPATV